MSEKKFAFGENWQRFLKCVNDERVNNARQSLVEFLNLENLVEKTFVDIGCGSGLFSYAAYLLGAKEIVSLDVDPFCVECCKYLHQKAGSPTNWRIHQGSVLDGEFLSSLGFFDIVYSWGVLHHTGNMREAIKKTAPLVKKSGLYYIAIYNKVEGIVGSEFWLKVKRQYNASSKFGKFILEVLYEMSFFLFHILRFNNPICVIKNHTSRRGMNWKTDVVDWLGGYPYEFASVEEISDFMRQNFPNYKLINSKITNTHGVNSFLFQKQ